MGIRVVFLPNCPLILSLHKHKGVGIFLKKKMRFSNRKSPLNNTSIDKTITPILLNNNSNLITNDDEIR